MYELDWLEKKFCTSINSLSWNLGTIFLLPTPKMYNNVDKKTILKTKLELVPVTVTSLRH